MHGLKSIGWVCAAAGWVIIGWRIVPNVFASSAVDGFVVAVAFFSVVERCLEWAMQHFEKTVSA